MSIRTNDDTPRGEHYYPLAERAKKTNLNRMSWGAIIAGTLTALVAILTLNLLGAAIGLAAIDPTEESNPLAGLARGGGIWWVFSNLTALYAGGWVAGCLSNSATKTDSMLHGFLSWTLYTLVSAWLLTSTVGSVISSTGSMISKAVATVGSGVQEVAPEIAEAMDIQIDTENLSLQDIKSEVYQLLEDTDKRALDPQRLESKAMAVSQSAKRNAKDAAYRPRSVDSQVERIFRKAENRFDNSAAALDKKALANVLADRTDMTDAEAMTAVNNWNKQYDEIRQETAAYVAEVKETALAQSEEVAEATSAAAFLAFFSLLLGAALAAVGGYNGREEYKTIYAGYTPEVI